MSVLDDIWWKVRSWPWPWTLPLVLWGTVAVAEMNLYETMVR